MQRAGAVDGLHRGDALPGFAAVRAGVHGQRPADRAGNAGQELAAGQAGAPAMLGKPGAGQAGAGPQSAIGQRFDPGEAATYAHHGAAKTTVADQ